MFSLPQFPGSPDILSHRFSCIISTPGPRRRAGREALSLDAETWQNVCNITAQVQEEDPTERYCHVTARVEKGGAPPILLRRKKQQKQDVGRYFAALLETCTHPKDLPRGRRLHAGIARKGLLKTDPHLIGSGLIRMYAKCGSLREAQAVFNKLPTKDVVSWGAIISAYAKHGRQEQAMKCFEQMRLHLATCFSAVTFVAILKACGSLGALHIGEEIHAEISREGLLETDMFVGNALVDMYAKCGSLIKALEVFDNLLVRDVVSWNTLIAGYTQHGYGREVLDCFDQMQVEGVSPTAITFACSLNACGMMRAGDKGQEIHAEISRSGLLERDIVIGNALVDMYAKCGLLAKAQNVFDSLPVRDANSWSILIAGYSEQGHSEAALECFSQMRCEGLLPNLLAFVSCLKACASIGAIKRGQEIHAIIDRRGLLKNDVIRGTALAEMYVKCGSLAKAQEVFDQLPKQGTVSWNKLINYENDKEGYLNALEK